MRIEAFRTALAGEIASACGGMTVEDKPKPGRAKPVAEHFEIMESDPTAHLTEAQKRRFDSRRS